MRSKSSIQQELYDRLTDPRWLKLRNSLIGRELIAYGTELLSMSDAINSAVVSSFDYNQADERSLISLAHSMDLGISFQAPAWIRVRVTSPGVKVFSPYTVQCQCGAVTFTNIDYCNTNQVITLYQGNIRFSRNNQVVLNGTLLKNSVLNNASEIDWDSTEIALNGDDVFIHKLGQVIPASVMYFVGTLGQSSVNNIQVVNRYNPLRYGPDVLAYKYLTMMDGTLAVIEGNGVWGKEFESYSAQEIVWLEPTNNEFDLSSIQFTGDGVLFNNVEVVSSAMGATSLVYARDQFRKALYELLPTVSKHQVKEFVNSHEFVVDSEVTANEFNVTVYVKPVDLSDNRRYGDLEAELDTRGQLGASFRVMPGEAVPVLFIIHTELTEAQKSVLAAEINRLYAYEDTSFSWVPSTESISALLQSLLGVTARVSFLAVADINQVLVGNRYLPLPGSVKIYSGVGNELLGGDDSVGHIYTYTGSENISGWGTGITSEFIGLTLRYSGAPQTEPNYYVYLYNKFVIADNLSMRTPRRSGVSGTKSFGVSSSPNYTVWINDYADFNSSLVNNGLNIKSKTFNPVFNSDSVEVVALTCIEDTLICATSLEAQFGLLYYSYQSLPDLYNSEVAPNIEPMYAKATQISYTPSLLSATMIALSKDTIVFLHGHKYLLISDAMSINWTADENLGIVFSDGYVIPAEATTVHWASNDLNVYCAVSVGSTLTMVYAIADTELDGNSLRLSVVSRSTIDLKEFGLTSASDSINVKIGFGIAIVEIFHSSGSSESLRVLMYRFGVDDTLQEINARNGHQLFGTVDYATGKFTCNLSGDFKVSMDSSVVTRAAGEFFVIDSEDDVPFITD